MNTADAAALLADAVPRDISTWADFGAGNGTFTRALARLLPSGSSLFAVDRDRKALAALENRSIAGIRVIPVVADFTRPLALAGSANPILDGMLFANALHFVPDPAAVLERLAPTLREGGRLVVVEYDGRGPNRWVPYPLPPTRLAEIVTRAGFSESRTVARRPSTYGGVLYVAAAERVSHGETAVASDNV